MEHKKEQKFIFLLLHSALNQTVWSRIPEGLDWKYVYTLCKYHKIANMVSYALDYADEAVQGQIPENVRQVFFKAREKGMAREATQYFSLEEIQKKFEEHHIDNIPLKGAQLKPYYPSPDMRFLTDLDILCHKEDGEKISMIMEELGYTMDHGGGHHDVYVRRPFMTVEIHWICSTNNPVMDQLFDAIWERCTSWGEYSHSYGMPWEDYYVYMVGHMAKHLKYSGIGIRMLLDFYIFEKFLGEECDWKYIETHLEEAKLLRFAKTMSRFLQNCFKGEAMSEQEQILWDYIWGSGACGTMENHTGVRLLKDGGSKISILKNRLLLYIHILFPPLEGMQQNYSYLRKCPVLLPIAWLERLVKKTLFEKPKSLKILKAAGDTKQLKKMEIVCRVAGLY